jgi:long-chain acyl-CoA synthetase
MFYRFDPRVALDVIRETRPTFATGVITALNALIEHPTASEQDFASLRVVYSGGAPIAPALLERFRSKTGVQLHSIYGLTETTSPSHAMPLNAQARVDPESGALSVGPPVTGTECWIEDPAGNRLEAFEPGEIVIRGPQVVPGYWNKPEETAKAFTNGWFHTGDAGFIDSDGFIFVVDRIKDMVLRGGENVYCVEVETALFEVDAVKDCAVIGLPHEKLGEEVAAVIVAADGHGPSSAEEVLRHLGSRLSAFKVPSKIFWHHEDLPRNAAGKVLKKDLREFYS